MMARSQVASGAGYRRAQQRIGLKAKGVGMGLRTVGYLLGTSSIALCAWALDGGCQGKAHAQQPGLRSFSAPALLIELPSPQPAKAVDEPVATPRANAPLAAEPLQAPRPGSTRSPEPQSPTKVAQSAAPVTAQGPANQAKPGPATPPSTPAATPQPAIVPAAPSGSWPKTLPEAKAEAEARANPDTAQLQWPAGEIELAKARCTALLKGIEAVTISEAPVREGACGAAAPVRLVSIGRNPEVSLSPPPLVTCDMVVAMHKWVKGDLQPLARKHLGSAVIKIETMSDYSCRNAYGRAKNKLSEHGKANAIDIRGFTTAKGQTALLLDDWGLTGREIAAQVAAAKAAAERVERARAEATAAVAAKKAQGVQEQPPAGTQQTPPVLAGGGATLIEGLPKVTISRPGLASGHRGGDDGSLGVAPSQLGGPKSDTRSAFDVAQAPANAPRTGATGHGQSSFAPSGARPSGAGTAGAQPTVHSSGRVPSVMTKTGTAPMVHTPAVALDGSSGKARFLREAHAAACRIFGTTLGPEANNAHKNHFHVDMAERKLTNFCE